MQEIRRVGVIGAGTMGNGIAHVFARSGHEVLLCEVEQRFLDRGMETLRKNLEREAAKGKISAEDMQSALKRVTGVLDRNRLVECDFVIEAATEKFETKKRSSSILTGSYGKMCFSPPTPRRSRSPNWPMSPAVQTA